MPSPTQHIDAEILKLVLETNAPQMGELVLTRQMIYHPELKNENNSGSQDPSNPKGYPWITSTVKYPKSRLIRFTQENLIRFFFDKIYFLSILKDTIVTKDQKIRNSDYILEYNVTVMLELLFPTAYPVVFNNRTSYETFIQKKDTRLTFKGAIPLMQKMFRSLAALYSYLKVNGKIYTVTSTMLLNDILNHPKYRELFENYIQFQTFKAESKEDIKTKLDDKMSSVADMFVNKIYNKKTEPQNSTTQTSKKPDDKITLDKKLLEIINDTITTVGPDSTNSRYIAEKNDRYKRVQDEIIKLNKIVIRIKTPKTPDNDDDDDDDDDKIYNLNIELIEAVQKLNSTMNDLPNLNSIFPSTVLIKLRKIFEIVSDIIVLNEISVLFLVDDTVIGELFENNENPERRKMIEYLKTHYKNFFLFVNQITEFRRQNRSASNVRLQSSIESFIQQTNSKGSTFKDLGDAFKAKTLENREKDFHDVRVGLTISSGESRLKTYEAYVYMTLIGGELNEEKIKKISCVIKDHDLGNSLKTIMMTQQLEELNRSSYTYFSIDDDDDTKA